MVMTACGEVKAIDLEALRRPDATSTPACMPSSSSTSPSSPSSSSAAAPGGPIPLFASGWGLLGTETYVAPEREGLAGFSCAASDVYSAGRAAEDMVLYVGRLLAKAGVDLATLLDGTPLMQVRGGGVQVSARAGCACSCLV